MGTKQTFDDLRRKIISNFEALDICLKTTEKDSYRLNLLLNDLENYLNDSKTDFEVVITCCFQDYFTDLQYRRKKTLDIEINELDYDQMDFQKILEESRKVPKKKSCTELLNDFFDKQWGWQNMEWLWEWQGFFLNIIEINNFDSLNDLPKTETNKPDFETVFFPSEFTTLYQLKKDLLKYCEPQQHEPQTTKENKKPKGYVNQLTHEQKQFLDELIKAGSKESHVYCELKTNQIITLTEFEFIDYLNQFHNRNYPENKRFTSSKHLSIPIELSLKVKEFKSKITK